MSPYIYTFIRRDIPPEQKIVQLGHAAWEAGQRFEKSKEIASLILLSVANQRELIEVAKRLDIKGIGHYMFFEPDNEMGFSAICTRPVYDRSERSFFKRYSLYTA